MSAYLDNEYGKITYSDSYIINIAGISAVNCYGVVGMTSITTMDGINDLLKIEDFKKGVRVSVDQENRLNIQLNIIVLYGTSLSAISNSIMETVKYNVETATGVKVNKVDVVISGIRVK